MRERLINVATKRKANSTIWKCRYYALLYGASVRRIMTGNHAKGVFE